VAAASARAQSRREGREALLKIKRELGDLKTTWRSVLIQLMTSFRDAEAFEELIDGDYIRDVGYQGQIFYVTEAGYNLAEKLIAESDN